jgi:DNA helicase-2/ATP-dependent DNA helicase PcrA
MHPILAQLNPEQRRAVELTEGPLLVLAGAGSGKTKVLTHRIAYLIDVMGIKPGSILAVTFTNKAANEMKERVRLLLTSSQVEDAGEGAPTLTLPRDTGEGRERGMPVMGTFHAICAQILRRDIHHLGRSNTFVIFDTIDQASLVRSVLKEAAPYAQFSPRAVLSEISRAKSKLISPSVYVEQSSGDYFHEIVAQVYPRYQELLRQNEALDFDDLLSDTVALFEHHPEVLNKYQHLFTYILIDEYQDTNPVQYQFARLLSQAHHNICVVGDDDQAIYAFRGATVENILSFERDYPEARVVKLEQNYRSTKAILDAANAVIVHNPHLQVKNLWTDKQSGKRLVVYKALNEIDEARYVVETMIDLKAAGVYPYREMAVLYRTNAQSRAFEEACIEKNVPYRLVGGVKFYERKEIKDVLAYLRLIHNHDDRLSFERIVNVPPRGIGATTLKEFVTVVNDRQISIKEGLQQLDDLQNAINTRGLTQLKTFYALLRSLWEATARVHVLDLFDDVVRQVGYLDYLNDGSPQSEERFENVQELRSVVSQYTEFGPGAGLEQFWADTALMTDIDRVDLTSDAVTLITMHAVKGLEFGVVSLAGMEEGLFPHSRSMLEEKQLEEERRLCYVGLTRAKEYLYLTHARMRSIYGDNRPAIPSRYLQDIPIELLEQQSWEHETTETDSAQASEEVSAAGTVEQLFRDGDEVEHATFGRGRVVHIKGDEIAVAFPGAGVKRLLQSVAPLKRLSK